MTQTSSPCWYSASSGGLVSHRCNTGLRLIIVLQSYVEPFIAWSFIISSKEKLKAVALHLVGCHHSLATRRLVLSMEDQDEVEPPIFMILSRMPHLRDIHIGAELPGLVDSILLALSMFQANSLRHLSGFGLPIASPLTFHALGQFAHLRTLSFANGWTGLECDPSLSGMGWTLPYLHSLTWHCAHYYLLRRSRFPALRHFELGRGRPLDTRQMASLTMWFRALAQSTLLDSVTFAPIYDDDNVLYTVSTMRDLVINVRAREIIVGRNGDIPLTVLHQDVATVRFDFRHVNRMDIEQAAELASNFCARFINPNIIGSRGGDVTRLRVIACGTAFYNAFGDLTRRRFPPGDVLSAAHGRGVDVVLERD
jgi:hypothetical protein